MCPASGARLPVIKLNAVVFPAPFPPIRLVMVPAATSKERLLTACRPPKDFDSASSLRSVPPVAGEKHEEEPVEHLAQLRRDRFGDGDELECLGEQDQHGGGKHRAVQA